ncbi:hypothetical protein Salat_1465800 [Sesamum alatum]|uniref:Uncharacterized protein n=1 Tax=Sesamum alatum TaxID=300844 RepID=A0AAE1YB56_9LAMI|nr:hypothetical protein Salat_1465800 [Sesamum alatum]
MGEKWAQSRSSGMEPLGSSPVLQPHWQVSKNCLVLGSGIEGPSLELYKGIILPSDQEKLLDCPLPEIEAYAANHMTWLHIILCELLVFYITHNNNAFHVETQGLLKIAVAEKKELEEEKAQVLKDFEKSRNDYRDFLSTRTRDTRVAQQANMEQGIKAFYLTENCQLLVKHTHLEGA